MPSNFNSTTPAAPAGFTNVVFQTDGNGNDSAYVPASSGGPGGSSGDIQFNDGAGDFGGSAATINTAGSITIPEGQVIEWSGGYGLYSTAAISALASDTLAIGDGSPGDVSGAAAMTALILFGSSSYYDYNLFHTTIYSGAEQNWSLILPPNPGTSGQVLTTNGSGVTYWETPSGGGGGGGSVTSFSSGNLSPLFTTSVATPTTTPALSFSLNTQNANTVFAGPTSGGAAAPTFRALVAADLPAGTWATLTGDLTETQVIPWDGGTVGTPDTGISRISAGVLGIGTGAQGSSNGTIVAASGAIASQIAGTLGTQLATPNAPTITFVGSTSGSPTWSYKLVAYDQFGFETLPSTAGTITSSNTTLSSSNYNVITAPSTLPLGCVGWNVYRTAVATSPTTTGIIGQITTAGGTLNDTALPGDGSTVPLWNFTGLITSAASAGAGSCGLLTPFHEATLMIADTTEVFVGNSTINQLKAIQCYCARTVTVNRMTLDVVHKRVRGNSQHCNLSGRWWAKVV